MIEENDFVTPYPQPLFNGDLGLTAADIAKSLGVEAKDIRTKLKERGFLERIELQCFRAATFVAASKSNGLAFEEIVLDVSAAKFFVGKHNSPLGDSYLGFLIRLEKRVDMVLLESSNDPILQSLMQAQALRLNQIEQGRKLVAIEQDLDDQGLNPEQVVYLSRQIDERLLAVSLPLTAKGYMFNAIKERFLPAGAGKTDFTWSRASKKHFEAIKEFVAAWQPALWQRQRAISRHNTGLTKKMLKEPEGPDLLF